MGNVLKTIRKIVTFINNEEENGGLWLPNIQRYFVWNEEQMEKLFDSIMRKYPISTLLFWRTDESIKIRKFIDHYHDKLKLTDFYITDTKKKKKMIVLDGQQRLQAFYVALKGSYNRKELYFNVLSGDNLQEEIRYKFKFLSYEMAQINDGWVKLKDLVYSEVGYYEDADRIIEKIGNVENPTLVRQNIARVQQVFTADDIIIYQELDSIDNPSLYSLNDIVEVFIRANSGGTPLGKSELMFTLLVLSWEEIEEELLDFLNILNRPGYKFTRDFILKTSLILIGTGAKYDVHKFRVENNIQTLRDNWNKIKDAISDIRDFMQNNTFIRSDKALPSYLALIPIIYFKFRFPEKWRYIKMDDLGFWLTRVLLTGAFSGSSDSILDVLIRDIKEKEDFDIDSINSIIIERNRSVSLSPKAVLDSRYGQKKTYLIFYMLYKSNMPTFIAANDSNLPSLDHIFPQSLLKNMKVRNPRTNRAIAKYSRPERDQIANLMVLSLNENCDEKRATPPDTWFADKDESYLQLHMIPSRQLLDKENFEGFIKQRKKLIISRLRSLNLLKKE